HMLPVLLDSEGFTKTHWGQWFWATVHGDTVARAYAHEVLDFLLMAIAVMVPVRSFFRRQPGQPVGGTSSIDQSGEMRTAWKRRVVWAAGIGFFVAVFWTVLAFLLFAARPSIWIDIFWKAVHITCPFWALPFPNGLDLVARPLLNAALYGLIV